ncbi:MAG TPA: hypothetical protein VFD13_03860 [Candidatus Kapabacteria bacterium]|nr:hypothetical protein [Candidatus Kapabacteria bacterium]
MNIQTFVFSSLILLWLVPRPAHSQPPNTRDLSVSISVTRTVSESSDLHKSHDGTNSDGTENNGCIDYEKESGTATITYTLNSDRMIATDDGDRFELISDAKVFRDRDLPFSGAGSWSTQSEQSDETKGPDCPCPSSAKSSTGGAMPITSATSTLHFIYDRKPKEGHFSITPALGIFQGKGHSSTKDCNSSDESDDPGSMSTVLNPDVDLSNFNPLAKAHWSPDVAAQFQKALDLTGNGGICTITQTKQGFEATYTYSATVDILDTTSGWKGKSTETVTTSVHLIIGGKPIQFDAILTPTNLQPDASADYDRWIPEGPDPTSKSSSKGNSIAFRVMLVNKSDPEKELTDVDYSVKYELDDVSHNPGYCTN